MTRWGDERAQSIQVGAIVLFGFVVLAFSGYQAGVVPQQNQEVEFSHSLQVGSDMQELRNDLLEAGATGRMRNVDVALGTTYPSRVIAVNPAPPGGKLRTQSVDTGEITLDATGVDVEEVCGYDRDGDDSVPSKSFVYDPSYNVYSNAPTVTYENTVTYRRFGERDIVDSSQRIIDGKRITLVPLVGNYSESGSGTVTVDFQGGLTGVSETNSSDNATLTIPTRLNASQWETILADELSGNGGNVVAVSNNGSRQAVDIELAERFYTVTCPVVGVGFAPANRPRQGPGEGSDGINPSGAGDVRLSGVERDSSNKDVLVLSFTNPGEDVNLSDTRFSFYQAKNDDGPARLDMFDYDGSSMPYAGQFVDNLELKGPSKPPSSTVTFSGDGGVTTVAVEFEHSDDGTYQPSQEDMAVLNLQFEDGQGANYFIDIPPKGSTSSTPTATPTATPTGAFESASVTNLDSTSDSESQTFSFTIGDAMPDSTTVTIDLANTGNGQAAIEYSGAAATASGSGTASMNSVNDAIEYQVPSGGLSSGEQVTISVSNVDPGKNSDGTYSVTFTQNDTGGSTTVEFTVT